jgi:hypothetical protein
MRKGNSVAVAIVAMVVWALLPRGVARAQVAEDIYWTCSSFQTIAPGTSLEEQVTCTNAGDIALGGGYETQTSTGNYQGVSVSVPENSFYFSDSTSIGWQGVEQNNTVCRAKWYGKPVPVCPTVSFRVCVSCLPASPVC